MNITTITIVNEKVLNEIEVFMEGGIAIHVMTSIACSEAEVTALF